MNASNEDLKRELKETKQKLAKADAEAKEKARLWEPESSISLACLRGNELEDPEKWSEYLKNWLSQKKILPKGESFAVCRLKPKEASRLWYLFPPFKWMFDACLNNRRRALENKMARGKEVGSSDINECCDLVPLTVCGCRVSNSRGGTLARDGNNIYFVRPRSKGLLCWLFCPCKRRGKEICKLECEEFALEVASEESLQRPRIPELCDVLSTEEQGQFEKLLPEINGKSFISLDNNEAFEPNEDDGGPWASYEELGEPEVGNKYRTIFFVFEPCFFIWDGLKKAKSIFFGK